MDAKKLEEDQNRAIQLEWDRCETLINSYVPDSDDIGCPPFFDTIRCWPATPANTTSTLKCPDYVVGFLEEQNATRLCENGNWNNWTDYTHCMLGNTTVVSIAHNVTHSLDNLKAYVPLINLISRTGYSISFITLVLAFLIMFSIKKLHCARNRLHMHLFASFIMRAGMRLLKDILFPEGGINLPTKLLDGDKYIDLDEQNSNWSCKLFTSLFNFFITANYSWILMEGLYLYNLIFRSMFADSHTKITQYIVLGWGMPLLVVGAWTIARIFMEDTLCWTTHDQDKMTFWIIRIPTAASIMLNLYLFVRIAYVIYMKLQPPSQEQETRSYRKWARSTLVLAPLFGIHYAILIGMSSSSNETVEIIWLFADQLFASFNGFVVAILYCFLNSEVRTELKPHVHAFLVYIATHSCLKYLFPCRERYLRSARGRTSVCTTMSCSSLFNNAVNHRNSRAGLRSDQVLRSKNDRNKEHVCHPNARYFQDEQARSSRGAAKQLLTNGSARQNARLGCLEEDFAPETFSMLPEEDQQQERQTKISMPD